ncbi:MAG: hypothetical protein AVDCRST_MAG74-248 [uncultured Pyrinomonadaceae bacterium]|uniref:TonB C-terminal domain-containing protein n=1 Tax=uncultured Pyrinomonadaceae bacterium TaxID=2283094 RepID=A0A6J4ND15_9BACT|nr:MAG: hypothetical protein AVDCRST_MAG74-248 [uncultured Pyrinomonadaceae bacterium]
MLDQLVESKNNAGENTRRSGFLLTTFVIMTSILVGGWMYSLFAKDYGLGSGDLELSELVAPVPMAEEEPPPPEPEQPKQEQQKAAPNADVRKEVFQAMEESPQVPDKVSVEKQTIPARRPNVLTLKGDQNISANNAVDSSYRGPVSTDGKGVPGPGGVPNSGNEEGGAKPPPPPPPPPPAPKPAVPKKISGGVLNGKATSLPKPPYPAAARAVRASGAVNVQVTISESGSVVSASAVSGHPLLRQAAEQAARSARFAPTLLSGQAVSVTGVIVYNFVP